MDTQVYPGKGLSPSQLIFALNEELKRLMHNSPSFTLDEVSQLDRDTLTALAAIREWKNSFVPINRVPLEILSLVPTHLSSQEDRFRATFVCRHWRRTFLQHGALWSQLYLSKGEVYVKTLLERAKGSTLRVFATWRDPAGATALLPPHIKQTGTLDFLLSSWANIRKFSEFDSGPLPLLHTLNINAPDVMSPSSLPLFSNAVNLQAFRLSPEGSQPLKLFAFPNLTSFELSMASQEEFWASDLLDFLEASPMLQVVHVKILVDIFLDGVPQERVVVLPNVESLSLAMSDSEPGYKLAAHISCPSAKHTSLTYEHEKDADGMIPHEIFPASVSWNAIIRQYTRSPIEEVALEMKTPSDYAMECSLEFRSPNATIIRLCFDVAAEDDYECKDDEDRVEVTPEMYWEAFSQACRTIRDLTLLTNIKRLRICHTGLVSYHHGAMGATNEIGQLFKSVGPLEELVLHHCDMGVYLDSFHNHRGLYDVKKPVVFPTIKELEISHPLFPLKFEVAIVGLVELQHVRGVPFEHVTVRMDRLPAEMAEKLRPWVGVVHCYNQVEPA